MDKAHYCELLENAESELKTVQTRMIRDRYVGNAKDRVARALRQIRKGIKALVQSDE